ncbi:MAG: methyltransferase domain-containing protein, partial [Gemmatimonadota bacterium]
MEVLTVGKPPGPFRAIVQRLLPLRFRKTLGDGLRRATRWPPIGGVELGRLGSTEPISPDWGFDRGQPIDRYYIERFLEARKADVRGRVLEVLNDHYTVRYGGDRVTHSDVLHHVPGNPKATVVADLTVPDSLPEASYDCVICTQTLQFIYDVGEASRTLHRVLKPGGTLLATVPGITRISSEDMERSGDYWRFTRASVRRLLADAFGHDRIDV